MEDLVKNVIALIDETLGEIQELKKSERFKAAEISIEGPGSDLAGKPTNGSLGKEEDKDDDEDDKKDDEAKKAEDDDDEDDDEGSEDDIEKAEHKDEKEDDKRYAKKEHGHDVECTVKDESGMPEGTMKKSLEASEALMKSYIDDKVGSLETKLNAITDLIKKLGDTPVPSKGVRHCDVTPLQKSQEVEPLSKSVIIDKLLDLKKSGERVETQDITRVEVGTADDAARIANKYKLNK